jgi:hypothetical protein
VADPKPFDREASRDKTRGIVPKKSQQTFKFIALKKGSCSRNVSINPAFNKIKAFILINNNKLMTKENLKEYIELLKHQISISTSKQQIKQFKKLIKEAKQELKNDYKIFLMQN